MASVVGAGSAPLDYQWLKDGLALPGQTNESLTLSNLAIADGGIYNVIVSNGAVQDVSGPFGVMTSAAASVTVTAPPLAEAVNNRSFL